MRGFGWTHLILAILIIVFASRGSMTLVIVLAAILAVFSLFGVFSYCVPNQGTVKKVAPKRKQVKRKKAKKRKR
tara:strand:+ start:279 stop:500 length:222 start_codon:yes stop_codon:yes gene_type:complete